MSRMPFGVARLSQDFGEVMTQAQGNPTSRFALSRVVKGKKAPSEARPISISGQQALSTRRRKPPISLPTVSILKDD